MTNKKFLRLPAIFTLIFSIALAAFAQADAPRQTIAVTYPQDETVNLQFRGTTRFPRMKGEAKIKRTARNGTEIDLSVSKMPRPFELGAGYATYVLWAISPDGQVDNLGEIKRRGIFIFFEFDSKISVTTPLQNFALIITAEPHFLVRRPSRAIMLENLNPTSKSGKTVATTKTIQYFGNASDYFNDARTPEIAETDYSKTPSAILQGKQAVALARYAGAQRDALPELQTAETLLQNAEAAWQAGRDEAQVDVTARQAISAAVKAEDTAVARREAREKRNAQTRQDAEIRQAEEKYEDTVQQMNNLRAELAREQRTRELSERDAANYAEQIRVLREENARLREELGKTRSESESSKIQLARIEAEKQTIERQREQDERINRLKANMPILMQSLKRFGTVKQTEQGIIVSLNESLWAGVRDGSFAATADAKLSDLGNVLANNVDYRVKIESHTDNRGTPEDLQTLTQTRAQAIADRLAALGVDASRVEAKGFGATFPAAPNTTVANRAKNRRTEIILVPTF